MTDSIQERIKMAEYWANYEIRGSLRRLARMGLTYEVGEEHPTSKAQRLALKECRRCFYFRGPRVAGQALTPYLCNICGTETLHSNTSIPLLCKECATKHQVCTRCYCPIDAPLDLPSQGAAPGVKKARSHKSKDGNNGQRSRTDGGSGTTQSRKRKPQNKEEVG